MLDIDAVVFDMDGLLLDTEAISLTTFIEACKAFGFNPDLEVYYRCIGTNSNRVKEILFEGYGRDYPFEAVYKYWKALYQAEAVEKPVPLKTGVLSLLGYLEKEGFKTAVVTSTRREVALRKLENSRIIRYFSLVLCGDQVSRSKPDPEIYSTACLKLEMSPAKCLALEDSDNGVLSAFNAGLTVIQVPDMKEPSPEVRALGHRIVKSLTEVEKILRTGSR